MQFEARDIDTLEPYPHNTREHRKKDLAVIRESIERFGFVSPLVVQAGTGFVLGGNGRLQALQELGMVSGIPCTVVDLDDQEALALNIVLNRSSELSRWDKPMLSQALVDLRKSGISSEAIGFRAKEAERLIENAKRGPIPRRSASSDVVRISLQYNAQDAARFHEAVEELSGALGKDSSSDVVLECLERQREALCLEESGT